MGHRSARVIGLGVVVLICSVAVGVLPAAGHAKMPVTFKGPVTCSLAGSFTAKPPLTLATDKATKLSLTASGTCEGATTSHGVTIESATLTGSSVDTSASCVRLESGLPKMTAVVRYRSSGGSVAPTRITFTDGTMNHGATRFTFTYPAKQGSGKATGSYAGKPTAYLVIRPAFASFLTMCQRPGGLNTIAVVPGSTLTP